MEKQEVKTVIIAYIEIFEDSRDINGICFIDTAKITNADIKNCLEKVDFDAYIYVKKENIEYFDWQKEIRTATAILPCTVDKTVTIVL